MKLSATIVLGALVGVIVATEVRTMVHAANDRERSPKQVTIIDFNDDGQRIGPVTVDKVIKTDAEWKKQLTQADDQDCSIGL